MITIHASGLTSDPGSTRPPDRAPTPQEEAAAAQQVERDVAEHEEEMLKRGANQQGEGRVP